MATIMQIIEHSGVYLGYLVGFTYIAVGVAFAIGRIANSAGLVPENGKGPIVEFLSNFKQRRPTTMLGLIAYIGIIVFFLRLMRLLHERDLDALKRGDDLPVAERRRKGFLSFLDQARSEA